MSDFMEDDWRPRKTNTEYWLENNPVDGNIWLYREPANRSSGEEMPLSGLLKR